jgi:hypothetical protein
MAPDVRELMKEHAFGPRPMLTEQLRAKDEGLKEPRGGKRHGMPPVQHHLTSLAHPIETRGVGVINGSIGHAHSDFRSLPDTP